MNEEAGPNPGDPAKPADPCTIVIFGAAGDLTKRKLYPALYNLKSYGVLPKDFAVIGVARRELSDQAYSQQVTENVHEFATGPVDEAAWADFKGRVSFSHGEFNDPKSFQRLGSKIEQSAKAHRTGGNVLFYLATPPDYFGEIIQQLGAAGLTRQDKGWRRVIIEKPFGRDLPSAIALNQEIRSVLKENQIFRIDHYLGKETVQNILVFRFANGIFEPTWNRRYIDHVRITVAETLGVEGRGRYYDKSGVLRDVIQNHMFQLLAMVAMEPPSSLDAEAVRNEKVKVFDCIRPMNEAEIRTHVVRGQYGEGTIAGKKVPAYRKEHDVNPDSDTETFAALKLTVENWRWAGVPFYLRSGKRLALRTTEIAIQFRKPPLMLFRESGVEDIDPNRLVIHVQPDEGITLHVKAKQPGPAIRLAPVKLDFNYKDFGSSTAANGYEQLLYDCMIGDSTLFHRADMVEAAWKIATPILDYWNTQKAKEFPNYPSGSWGPEAAETLLRQDGRRWFNPR